MTAPENDNHWRWKSACLDKWDIFDGFYDEKNVAYYPHIMKAQAICDTCPVFEECKIDGKDETQGIWAGEGKGGK